jgi:hypothetical protein
MTRGHSERQNDAYSILTPDRTPTNSNTLGAMEVCVGREEAKFFHAPAIRNRASLNDMAG